jgi:hypothetical protein
MILRITGMILQPRGLAFMLAFQIITRTSNLSPGLTRAQAEPHAEAGKQRRAERPDGGSAYVVSLVE